MNSRNATFVHEGASEQDMELFLGPLAPGEIETFKRFDANAAMADIMVAAGKFPSKGQARKNGFPGPIPHGYSHHVVGSGKNRMEVWVLNLLPTDHPETLST